MFFSLPIPDGGRAVGIYLYMKKLRKHIRSPRLLVNLRSSAFALGISIGGVDCLISEGRLPSRRVAGKVLIPATALQTFANAENQKLRS
jgi:hypothetical protein